jgi:hypothetical protein
LFLFNKVYADSQKDNLPGGFSPYERIASIPGIGKTQPVLVFAEIKSDQGDPIAKL